MKFSIQILIFPNTYTCTNFCNTFQFASRNEKRRIEGTGEAPAWQYYHEVDELLGSHNDHSMDMSNLDESNIMNSTSISMYTTHIAFCFCYLSQRTAHI